MLKMTMLLIFIVLFSTGPEHLSQPRTQKVSNSPTASTVQERNSLENAIGVITLNKKAYSKARKLQFFNEDGSLWYEFSFYDDGADPGFAQPKTEFQPFSFHPDYFLLALKCVGQDAKRFQVVVNESTRLTKFIRRQDESFKFQTWEKHILDLFAVGFDPTHNPLRTRPGGNVSTVRLPLNQITFHPLQIRGNWLKVSWNVSEEGKGKDKKVEYGWVKWKQNSQLLVEFFYFA